MIPTNYAMCDDPAGYPLCRSCKRNADNHEGAAELIAARGRAQAKTPPDDRLSCRHWEALWTTSGPEDRL